MRSMGPASSVSIPEPEGDRRADVCRHDGGCGLEIHDALEGLDDVQEVYTTAVMDEA